MHTILEAFELPGFREAGEKGYLFAESWGSTRNYFRGAGEQGHFLMI